MVALHASLFRALRSLQKATSAIPAREGLHINRANLSLSAFQLGHKLTHARPGLQALKRECNIRFLSFIGSEHELLKTLVGHGALQASAYSIAMRKLGLEISKKRSPSRWVHGA